MLILGTELKSQISATSLGSPSVGSTKVGTSETYTALDYTQAFNRAFNYIFYEFVENFEPQYEGTEDATSDFLQRSPEEGEIQLSDEKVRKDVEYCLYLATTHELETPNIYSITVSPSLGQQLKKSGSQEFYEDKGGVSSVTRANTEQSLNFQIHSILDKYRPPQINATNIDGTCPEDKFYFGAIPPKRY